MLLFDCFFGRCQKPSCEGCGLRPVRSLRLALKSRSMGRFEEDEATLAATAAARELLGNASCPPKPDMQPATAPGRGKKRLLVPREEIPWYPTIKPDLCNGCADCKVLCKPGVFESGPPDPTGIHRPKFVVARPYNCIVLCDRCVSICTSGAITLPDKADFEQYVEDAK